MQSSLIVSIEVIFGSILLRSGMTDNSGSIAIRWPMGWLETWLQFHQNPQDCKKLCRHCQGFGWIALWSLTDCEWMTILGQLGMFSCNLWISRDFGAILSIPWQSFAVSQSHRNSIRLWRLRSGLPSLYFRCPELGCIAVDPSPRQAVAACNPCSSDATLSIELQSFVVLQSHCNSVWLHGNSRLCHDWLDGAPFDAILHGFAIASQFNLIVWIAIRIGIFWADFVPLPFGWIALWFLFDRNPGPIEGNWLQSVWIVSGFP